MIESCLNAIVTAYNSEAYIANAIRSVLNQTRAWINFTIRSIAGEPLYRTAKRAFRIRMQTGGPR